MSLSSLWFCLFLKMIMTCKISKRYFKVIPYMGFKLCPTILCEKSLKFPSAQKSVYLEIGVFDWCFSPVQQYFSHIMAASTIKNDQFWNFLGGFSRLNVRSNSRDMVCKNSLKWDDKPQTNNIQTFRPSNEYRERILSFISLYVIVSK